MNQLNNNDYKQTEMDEPWLNATVEALREPLDFNVSTRLSSIRRRALEHPVKKPLFSSNYLWGVPVLASVFAVIVSFNIWQQPSSESSRTYATDPVVYQDLSILDAKDDIEFFQNLEFLHWMERGNDDLPKG